MKILIIEDEQSSAERLKRMLQDGNHEVMGVLASNAEAKRFFASGTQGVDLILSDIQLGDGLSFEALESVPGNVPVIFTTAFDHYAIQAFKYNGIDYLLKPIDATELHTAIGKVENRHIDASSTTTDTIFQMLASVKKQTIHYRERFLIPYHADEYLIILVGDVSHIAIKDGVVRLYTISGKSHILNMTLDEADSQLDPHRFMRVNRQHIVNAAAVEKASTYFLGKMRIHMKAYPDAEIIVSKDKVATVKRWLNS